MRDRTIAIHFVHAAIRGAQRQGFDCTALLKEVGIDVNCLGDSNARVAPEHFAKLLQLLWQRLDDEYLGLAKQRSKRGTFAMMGHTIIHCHNLEQALNRGMLFYQLFIDAPDIVLQREGERVRLIVSASNLNDPDHFLTESLLIIWHRLGSWLIGQRIQLEEASFAYPAPAHADEYSLFFPCPHQFGAPSTSLVFNAHYLPMPLLQDERSLRRFLLRSPVDLLARPDGGLSLSSQIRRLLGRDCRTWPDLEQIAQQLHASPQTLRRHLREEGTRFQELKDRLRCDLAIYYLGRADLPIQDITEQLGFSEPSAFHRAFKKWTGQTPGAYRAQDN